MSAHTPGPAKEIAHHLRAGGSWSACLYSVSWRHPEARLLNPQDFSDSPAGLQCLACRVKYDETCRAVIAKITGNAP